MLKAFFSCQDTTDNHSIKNMILELLSVLDVDLMGEYQSGEGRFNLQVQNSINQCDILISVQTESNNSSYLEQTINVAKSCGKFVIALAKETYLLPSLSSKSDRVRVILLMQDKPQFVVEIVETINSIKRTLEIPIEPILAQHSSKLEIESESWSSEIHEHLENIRTLFKTLNYEAIISESDQLARDFPFCWRAWIIKSAALVYLHQFETADQVLDEAIKRFDDNDRALSHAYQNKAWLRHTRMNSPLESEQQAVIDDFHRSIDHEGRLIVFLSLFSFLLLHNRIAEAETEWQRCLSLFPFAYAKQEFLKHLKSDHFIRRVKQSQLLSQVFSEEF